MKIEWLTALALCFVHPLGGNALGNNGTPADPSGTSFLLVQSVRQDQGRRFLGRCSGTAVAVDSVLTAAHCVVSEGLVRRYRATGAAAIEEARRSLELRKPWNDRSLATLMAELRGSGTPSELAPFAHLLTALEEDVRRLGGYEGHTVLARENGHPVSIPVTPGAVDVHPLYLASKLLELEGHDVPYDVALIRVPTRKLARPLKLLDSSYPLANARLELHGFGRQLDEIQPPPDDWDRDGVSNAVDLCPFTAAGAAVDASGCAPGDERLEYRFRVGAHRTAYSWPYPSAVFFSKESAREVLVLTSDRLTLHGGDEVMPGKGDSGSALVLAEPRAGGGFVPVRIAGIYHGPVGPRAGERHELEAIARYESVLNPTLGDWLNEKLERR